MPWRETCAMNERIEVISLLLRGEESISELARQFDVSRKTLYKWRQRHEAEGWSGLADRSRAPHHCPHRLDETVRSAVLGVRAAHPSWGPKKIRAWLLRHRGGDWPAASTIGALLKEAGLVVARRRRQRTPAGLSPLAPCDDANAVWCADFKGWFRTGDGARCDPFTLSDAASRYLLRCQNVIHTSTQDVWPILEAAFREYGLPARLRSDNGPPFAGRGVGGLSRLAVKLIKAGTLPERIRPGKPQDNGRHERMHLTLKQETASPPAANLRAQQRRFDSFRRLYNEDRPHEALAQTPPAHHYTPSARRYHGRLRSPDYDRETVRRVRSNGEIKWRGNTMFLSCALIGEPVGLVEIDDDQWRISYGPLVLAVIDPDGQLKRPTKSETPSQQRKPRPEKTD